MVVRRQRVNISFVMHPPPPEDRCKYGRNMQQTYYIYITLKRLHASVCFIVYLIDLMHGQRLSKFTVTFFLNSIISVWTELRDNSPDASKKKLGYAFGNGHNIT